MGWGICEGWGHQPPQFREAGRTMGAGCRTAQGHYQDRPGGGSSVTLVREREGRGGAREKGKLVPI